jgi:hypothetical protein
MRHTCGKQGMSRTPLFEKFCGKAYREDIDKHKHGKRAAMEVWRWNISICVKERFL